LAGPFVLVSVNGQGDGELAGGGRERMSVAGTLLGVNGVHNHNLDRTSDSSWVASGGLADRMMDTGCPLWAAFRGPRSPLGGFDLCCDQYLRPLCVPSRPWCSRALPHLSDEVAVAGPVGPHEVLVLVVRLHSLVAVAVLEVGVSLSTSGAVGPRKTS
jgi:hypothetical protein